MTLFLKADLTPEQMQQVSRKYPEADFSSISLDPGIMAGGKSQSFGQEEAGGCGGSQEGWLSRALRQQVSWSWHSLIMARQVPKTRSDSAKRTAAEMATGSEKAGFNAVLSHHKQTVLKTIVSLTCRM